jgi:flavin reductase (DIM6/NTAB) family NADH-FMN oxidoreductase RutF
MPVADPPPDGREMTNTLDARGLRNCFGHWATGVAVVSYELDGEPRGATINGFTSVSLDPPLVLVSLAKTARACEALVDRSFSVTFLGEDQLELALHFAGRQREGLVVPWAPNVEVPRLAGGIGWIECQAWKNYDGGDHALFLGEVVRYDAWRGKPLVFYTGDFRIVGLPIYELPRIVPLDGRPIAEWVGRAHRFHELLEHHPEYETRPSDLT